MEEKLWYVGTFTVFTLFPAFTHSVDIYGVPTKYGALWRVLSARREQNVTLAF